MRPAATSLLILCLAATGPAFARSTDRSQPMDIDADRTDALLGDDAVSVLEGNVKIRQGSLEVDADRAEIHRKAGEIDRIVLAVEPHTPRGLVTEMVATSSAYGVDLGLRP